MAAKTESGMPERLAPIVAPEKTSPECLTPTHEKITRSPSFRASHKRMSRRSKTPSINSLQCADNVCLVEEPEFDINDTVIINVGGVRHEVHRRTLQRHPETRLTHIVDMKLHYREQAKEFYFDRDPYVFSAVLNYYRYGELHLPSDICNVVVSKELKYWGIEEDKIEACCWLQYNAAWDQMHMLSQFEEKQTINVNIPKSEKPSCFQRIQPKIWLMLEDPYSSKAAQVLAWVSLAFVVVSIFSFCAETHPSFTSELSEEEFKMYSVTDVLRDLHIIGDKPSDKKSPVTNNSIDNSQTDKQPNQPGNIVRNTRELPKDDEFFQRDPRDNTNSNLQVQRQASHPDRQMYSAQDSSEQAKHESQSFNTSKSKESFDPVNKVVLRNKRDAELDDAVTEDTDNMLTTSQSPTTTMSTSTRSKFKRLTKPHPVLFFVDIICYCFFTFEIAVRFIFCDSKLAFFKDMFNVVDLIAVLPFYVEVIVNSLYREEQFKKSIVDVLLFTRILRIFRIFRLIRRHRGLQILVYTIRASMKEIMLLLLFVVIGTILFSSLVYYADEGSGKFESIPHSFWWAVITMTTVGYGDMYPVTPWGYVIGAGCSVSGVLLIAFTVPVIVNNFLLIYRYVQFQRDRPDPAEVEFRQKWEQKMLRSAESTLRLATVHVHVDKENEENNTNNVNAV